LQKDLIEKEVQIKKKDQEIAILRGQISEDRFSADQLKELNAELKVLKAKYDEVVKETSDSRQAQHDQIVDSKEAAGLRA